MTDKYSLSPFINVKYALDIAVAFIGLLLLAPLLIVIACAIRLDSTGSVLFRQQRVGLNGRPFNVYKFRSMVHNAENIGLGYNLEKDDPRITSVGVFLRKWSLDELPQILNILRGDMSFIGPRPTLQYQVDSYTPHQRKRLDMKPGITGWAQVNGRNDIPWETRIELDVWYVEHWSLWLDLRIFFRTFKVVMKQESIYNNNGISYDFGTSDKNNADRKE